ncbi:BrnT family toxin [Methylobacterium sp. J-026]|uniref:BrnT family toxin n=1 Tax=Methylobacterium sp. J-026 TaxID=2836624 RepID=UPI001FBBF492|nr:BrnT family toxin [Methylobacterium sp. J-026]MCJ2137802.1 BrnT family toxin [Methylobacterium sp. J-026]
MPTTWDEPKRLANLAKHGLDFADFDSCFDGETALIHPARASRTGRARDRLIGDGNGERVVAVIVSPLGTEVLSLVSLRIADPDEREAYARYRTEA